MMLNCFIIEKYDKLHGFMMSCEPQIMFCAKIITLSDFQMLAAIHYDVN